MGSFNSYTLKLLVSLLLSVSCPLVTCSNVTKCDYQADSCSCQTNEGVIDLNSLNKDKPYEIPDSAGTQTFYWAPCKDFTLQDAGFSAGGYQYVASAYYDIGVHSSAAGTVEDGHAVFTMTSADYARTTNVKCECAESVEVTFDKEDPETTYKFILKAPNCCTGSGPGPSGGSSGGGLSPGSIIVISFFSLLILYFVTGFLIQMKVRKAEGKERIPQIGFWSSLPGLVKDGVKFTLTCGKSTPKFDDI